MLTLSYSKSPSTQSLCCPRMYCTACFALTVEAPACPAMSAVVISPNRLVSSRILMICSRPICRVSLVTVSSRLFTRHT